jgi:hypothetical protein
MTDRSYTTADQAAELLRAARLYRRWADATGDYPHDEGGCIAHEALLAAVRAIDGDELVGPKP